jgi:hypothetical protein
MVVSFFVGRKDVTMTQGKHIYQILNSSYEAAMFAENLKEYPVAL